MRRLSNCDVGSHDNNDTFVGSYAGRLCVKIICGLFSMHYTVSGVEMVSCAETRCGSLVERDTQCCC